MKAAILSILILLAVGFFLRNVLSFLKIMFSAKKKSFRADNIIERAKGKKSSKVKRGSSR